MFVLAHRVRVEIYINILRVETDFANCSYKYLLNAGLAVANVLRVRWMTDLFVFFLFVFLYSCLMFCDCLYTVNTVVYTNSVRWHLVLAFWGFFCSAEPIPETILKRFIYLLRCPKGRFLYFRKIFCKSGPGSLTQTDLTKMLNSRLESFLLARNLNACNSAAA